MPLQGEVVYHQDHLGFGLRFIGLTDQEQEILEQLVRTGSQG
jgi:hypothetical protein